MISPHGETRADLSQRRAERLHNKGAVTSRSYKHPIKLLKARVPSLPSKQPPMKLALSAAAMHGGFDASHYQQWMDASAAKNSGAEFCWIKTTEATSYVDPVYPKFVNNCKSVGLPCGSYHFFRQVGDPGAQARFWFDHHIDAGAYAMLDLEVDPCSEGFVDALLVAADRLFGYPVILYSYDSFVDSHPWIRKYTGRRPLNIAKYSSASPHNTWDIWQNTDHAGYKGFGSAPDGDVTRDLSKIVRGSIPTPIPPKPITLMEDEMPTVVAQDFVVNPNDFSQAYVLDARGGLSAKGTAKAVDMRKEGVYWDGPVGPARKVIIIDWSQPAGYILDCLGGVHAFGGAPKFPKDGVYWPNGFTPPAPVT